MGRKRKQPAIEVRTKIYSIYAHPFDFTVYKTSDGSLIHCVEDFRLEPPDRAEIELDKEEFDRAAKVLNAQSLQLIASALDRSREAAVGHIPSLTESVGAIAARVAPGMFEFDNDDDDEEVEDAEVIFDATKDDGKGKPS